MMEEDNFSKEMEMILYHSDDGELEEQVVVSKMEITTPHGAIDGKTQTYERMQKCRYIDRGIYAK